VDATLSASQYVAAIGSVRTMLGGPVELNGEFCNPYNK